MTEQAITYADVYFDKDSHRILYDLLAERDETVNISHKHMPTLVEHEKFINKRPYSEWYIIYDRKTPVGSVYLSRYNEIGVFIFKEHQRKGYARQAVGFMIDEHPYDDLAANINPRNEASIELFKSFGFEHIQNTYRRASTRVSASQEQ